MSHCISRCMCNIDDFDQADIWNEKKVKTKKKHICTPCGRIIPVGTKTLTITSLYDGHWEHYYFCPECEAVSDYFCCSVTVCDLWSYLHDSYSFTELVDDPLFWDNWNLTKEKDYNIILHIACMFADTEDIKILLDLGIYKDVVLKIFSYGVQVGRVESRWKKLLSRYIDDITVLLEKSNKNS